MNVFENSFHIIDHILRFKDIAKIKNIDPYKSQVPIGVVVDARAMVSGYIQPNRKLNQRQMFFDRS